MGGFMVTSMRKLASGKPGTHSKKVASSTFPQDSETSEWVELLRIPQEGDKVPKGWLTAEQIGKIWRVTTTRAQKKLRDLYNRKAVERKLFRVFVNNRFYSIFHYKLKK